MIAGVDGCRGGWLVAKSECWPFRTPLTLNVCKSFAEVLDATQDCESVVVDMPIGLPKGP